MRGSRRGSRAASRGRCRTTPSRDVNRSPVSCMPSPESPAKRMMTRLSWTTCLLTGFLPRCRRRNGPTILERCSTLANTRCQGQAGARRFHPCAPGSRTRARVPRGGHVSRRAQSIGTGRGRPWMRRRPLGCGSMRDGRPPPSDDTGHTEEGRVTDLPTPTLGAPAARSTAPMRLDLEHGGRTATVWVLDVGLACCSVELMAAVADRRGARDAGAVPVDAGRGPRRARRGRHLHRRDGAARCGRRTTRCRTAPGSCPTARARTPAARTGTPTASPRASTSSCPSTSTCPGCPPRPEALLDAVLSLVEAAP